MAAKMARSGENVGQGKAAGMKFCEPQQGCAIDSDRLLRCLLSKYVYTINPWSGPENYFRRPLKMALKRPQHQEREAYRMKFQD